jgi:hypothetical protein
LPLRSSPCETSTLLRAERRERKDTVTNETNEAINEEQLKSAQTLTSLVLRARDSECALKPIGYRIRRVRQQVHMLQRWERAALNANSEALADEAEVVSLLVFAQRQTQRMENLERRSEEKNEFADNSHFIHFSLLFTLFESLIPITRTGKPSQRSL